MFSKPPSTLAAKLVVIDNKCHINIALEVDSLEKIKRLMGLIKNGNYGSEHYKRDDGDLNQKLKVEFDAFKDIRYQLQFATEQFHAAFDEMKKESNEYKAAQDKLSILIDQMKNLNNKVKSVHDALGECVADSKQTYQKPNPEIYKEGINFLKKQMDLGEKFINDHKLLIPKAVVLKGPVAGKSNG